MCRIFTCATFRKQNKTHPTHHMRCDQTKVCLKNVNKTPAVSAEERIHIYIQYIRLKKKCSFVWRISMLWWMHLNETHWFILNCHNQIWIRRHCGWCVCVFVCVKVNNARAYIHKHPVHYNVSAAQFTWKFWMTSQISGERKCAFPPQHHSDTQTKQILWIPSFWWRAANI